MIGGRTLRRNLPRIYVAKDFGERNDEWLGRSTRSAEDDAFGGASLCVSPVLWASREVWTGDGRDRKGLWLQQRASRKASERRSLPTSSVNQ